MELSDDQRALFEGKNIAFIATLMPDGSPQVTPVWVELDGKYIVVNTADGRVKARNVARDPRVAISVFEHGDPYTMVAVRGVVTEVTDEGADESIDRLAAKYIDQSPYPWRSPGERRIILRIRPEYIAGQ
jgi:PPOX class probable F420-dependent enzyme